MIHPNKSRENTGKRLGKNIPRAGSWVVLQPALGAGYPRGFYAINGQVSVLLGNGDGTFQPPRHFNEGGAGATPMVVADFKVDGKPDLATVNYSTGNISILLNITSFPK